MEHEIREKAIDALIAAYDKSNAAAAKYRKVMDSPRHDSTDATTIAAVADNAAAGGELVGMARALSLVMGCGWYYGVQQETAKRMLARERPPSMRSEDV